MLILQWVILQKMFFYEIFHRKLEGFVLAKTISLNVNDLADYAVRKPGIHNSAFRFRIFIYPIREATKAVFCP